MSVPTAGPPGLRAFSGALWTITTSIVSRAAGLIGTLILTRYLAPEIYGDVAVAVALVLTANQLSTLGVGQYVVAHPEAGRAVTFAATLTHVALGALALGALVLLRDRVGALLGAPGTTVLLPVLAVAAMLDRIAYVPERVLQRDLRFRVVALARMLAQLVYPLVSVAFAVAGWGGLAVIIGNLARALVRMAVVTGALDPWQWLVPAAPRMRQLRDMLAFGLPVSLGALAAFASRRWDTLLVSRFYGPAWAGPYNIAYSLAELPTVHVGEHVSEVLLPSFARMEPERRPLVLARSLRLLGLVMFPLALGLGAVAPTLVRAVLVPAWQPAGPLLVLLAAMSAAVPIGTTVAAYLQVHHRPVAVMTLEGLKLGVMLVLIATIGRLDPLGVCLAVDVGFIAHALVSVAFVARVEGTPAGALLVGLVRPLVACLPLLAAVAAVRAGAAAIGWADPVTLLIAETLAGAAAFGGAALLVAREATNDLADLASRALWPAAHTRARDRSPTS